MSTHRSSESLQFSNLGRRKVVAKFDGGRMSSDGGASLLREVDARCGLISRLAACFTDYRDPSRVEPGVERLLAQRIFGLCLGYEDLNDPDRLREDPALAMAVGGADIAGEERVRSRDRGHALARSKTLNRLELSEEETAATDRHKRIAANHEKMDQLRVELFLDSYEEPPERIIPDLDATDDVLHGNRFYPGYSFEKKSSRAHFSHTAKRAEFCRGAGCRRGGWAYASGYPRLCGASVGRDADRQDGLESV